MNTKTRQITILCAAQVGCLAIGLWMQHRSVQLVAEDDATRKAWNDLTRAADAIRDEAVAAGDEAPRLEPPAVDHALSILNRAREPRGGVLLADREWRVRAAAPAADAAGGIGFAAGASLAWTEERPAEGIARPILQPRRGKLTAGGEEYLAFARPLRDANGWLLTYLPLADIKAASAVLNDVLPTASIMTLLWTCVLMGIATYIIIARFHDAAEQVRKRAADESLRHAQNLIRTRDAVIFGLAKLADSRDPETGEHVERISVYSMTLARALAHDARFRDRMSPSFIRLIGISAVLHDIGKVGIEDRILRKPGLLTDEERQRIQKHTLIGGDCLRGIEQRLGTSNFLELAREITLAHHEHWDGSGYPYGLTGASIPLAARIVAVVDVYDALSSKRTYKDAYAHDECVSAIRELAGKQFDPDIVEVWLGVHETFREVAEQFGGDRPLDTSATGAPAPPEFATTEPLTESIGQVGCL